jgi:hypothetical protein
MVLERGLQSAATPSRSRCALISQQLLLSPASDVEDSLIRVIGNHAGLL